MLPPMIAPQIQASLEALQAALKAVDTAVILRETARLDELLAAHKEELDPRLAHFLQQRSYAKAMKLLQVEGGSQGPKDGRSRS